MCILHIALMEYTPVMVGRGPFAMVQHNQSQCIRPGFGLRCTDEIWFLGMAKQPTSTAFKQLELTSVVPTLNRHLRVCAF